MLLSRSPSPMRLCSATSSWCFVAASGRCSGHTRQLPFVIRAVESRPTSDDPLVSVITPAFNDAEYIEECVRSVVEQTLGNVEIIVVDDASTDDTPAVVTAIDAPGLRYFRHERNQGPAAARNTGLQDARGRYVAFLDADDAMNRDNLARKVEVLERHPRVAMVHSACGPVDGHGHPLRAPAPGTTSGAVWIKRLFPAILYGNPIITSSVLARKDAVDRVGRFDPRIHYAEDWDLWIRLARRFEFAYLHDALVRKRTDPDSMEWRSYVTHHDLYETEKILRKAFRELRLAEEGFDFRSLYWENYYRKLNNKAEFVPTRACARLYLRGVRHYPRGAVRPPGVKVAIKLVASALLPGRVIRRMRFQRHATRVAGGPHGSTPHRP